MEEISVNVHDLSTICRLCLATGAAVIDIFEFSVKMKSQLADVIMKCAPVQVTKHDMMPNLICRLCNSQLENIHQFQMQIVQSEKTLLNYLKQLHTSDKQIKSEYSIENSKLAVKGESLEKYNASADSNWKGKTPTNYTAVNLKHEIFLKSEIEDEPMDDNPLNLTEASADTIETLSKDEISCKDRMINIGHVSENFVHLRSKVETEYYDTGEEGTKNTLANQSTHKKAIQMKYQCDVCEICCTGLQDLKKHKHIHTKKKPYQCSICNKAFSAPDYLSSHKRTHTSEKPYQCDICNKCFSLSSYLNKHKLTHTDEKPYQCEICNKCSSRSDFLHRHKRIHTGEKPYQCNICSKCFSRSSDFSSHKRTHTGEKPYQCNICKKCFSWSSDYNRHKRTHTGEKPYQCDICNKGFSRSDLLNKHKWTHTGERPYQLPSTTKLKET